MNIWSRLGISVTIAAIFCIVMTEVFQSTKYYETYKWFICATFLALGCVGWVAGRFINARLAAEKARAKAKASSREMDEDSSSDGPPMLLNLCYWGAMLVLFGIIIVLIVPYTEAVKVVAARTDSEPAKPTPPRATNPPPTEVKVAPLPVSKSNVFPSLKLQGIVFRQPDPSVLINGRTYFLGDVVEEATVIAIQEETATVSCNGELRVLVLGK